MGRRTVRWDQLPSRRLQGRSKALIDLLRAQPRLWVFATEQPTTWADLKGRLENWRADFVGIPMTQLGKIVGHVVISQTDPRRVTRNGVERAREIGGDFAAAVAESRLIVDPDAKVELSEEWAADIARASEGVV